MTTDAQAARTIGDPHDEAGYKRLDKLRDKFLDAKDAYKSGTGEYAPFERARDAYQSLRTELRQAEEADPAHRRGSPDGVASVTQEG